MNTINEMSLHDLMEPPGRPSNLGTSKGSLVSMFGYPFKCRTRSLVSEDKSGRFIVARNGDTVGVIVDVWYMGGACCLH